MSQIVILFLSLLYISEYLQFKLSTKRDIVVSTTITMFLSSSVFFETLMLDDERTD
jgi:hypothetical protein